MDLITFFNLNKTYSKKLWLFVGGEWDIMTLNKFKKLNNIAFLVGGIEYRIINSVVLKVVK